MKEEGVRTMKQAPILYVFFLVQFLSFSRLSFGEEALDKTEVRSEHYLALEKTSENYREIKSIKDDVQTIKKDISHILPRSEFEDLRLSVRPRGWVKPLALS